jgi:hypothetical protein
MRLISQNRNLLEQDAFSAQPLSGSGDWPKVSIVLVSICITVWEPPYDFQVLIPWGL